MSRAGAARDGGRDPVGDPERFERLVSLFEEAAREKRALERELAGLGEAVPGEAAEAVLRRAALRCRLAAAQGRVLELVDELRSAAERTLAGLEEGPPDHVEGGRAAPDGDAGGGGGP